MCEDDEFWHEQKIWLNRLTSTPSVSSLNGRLSGLRYACFAACVARDGQGRRREASARRASIMRHLHLSAGAIRQE